MRGTAGDGKQPHSAMELESIWSHCSSRLSGEHYYALASPLSPLLQLTKPLNTLQAENSVGTHSRWGFVVTVVFQLAVHV